MYSKIKKTSLQNTKYLNAFNICVDSRQAAQITDLTLWVVSKHLSSKSLLQSIMLSLSLSLFLSLSFLYVDSCPGLTAYFFFFLLKCLSSSREVSASRYFDAGLSLSLVLHGERLYTVVCSWHIVRCPLINGPKFYGKCGFETSQDCIDHYEG